MNTKLTLSHSLAGTSSLVAEISAPVIKVPEYTKENPDAEGNYYGSATGMQGGCFNGRYYYQAFVKYCYNQDVAYQDYHQVNNAKNIVVIVKYDVISKKIVAISEEMDNLNHINDMTYNSKIGQLVICNNIGNTQRISYLNADNLKYAGYKDLSVNLYAIEYHASTDQYILGISGYTTFAIADSDFKTISAQLGGTSPSGEYTKQTLCCDDTYIYCLYYGNGTYHTTDLIMVYDWDGNLVTIIEVDFDNQEPENVSVCNGALFVATGESNNAYLYNISDVIASE